MAHPKRAEVLEQYAAGVSAISQIASQFNADEWNRPACGDWSAADTVRHVLGVVDWYHEWLDRAMAGVVSAPFDPSEFEQRNSAAVEQRRDRSGPAALGEFVDRATDYVDRAAPLWNEPYGFPLGTVTVGLHVGVAATEWHLHAWDLSSPSSRYEAANAEQLFVVAGTAMARVTGGLRGRMLGLAVPLAAKRNPWTGLLTRSGRRVT
jgi:uncharacterized protein (TIGR03083 family)